VQVDYSGLAARVAIIAPSVSLAMAPVAVSTLVIIAPIVGPAVAISAALFAISTAARVGMLATLRPVSPRRGVFAIAGFRTAMIGLGTSAVRVAVMSPARAATMSFGPAAMRRMSVARTAMVAIPRLGSVSARPDMPISAPPLIVPHFAIPAPVAITPIAVLVTGRRMPVVATTLALGTFSVAAAKNRSVPIRISRGAYRRLLRTRGQRVELIVLTRGSDGQLRRASTRVTMVATAARRRARRS